MLSVLEVDIVHSMANMSAPVASLIPFEVGSSALGKAQFRAEGLLSRGRLQREHFVRGYLVTPGADYATGWYRASI